MQGISTYVVAGALTVLAMDIIAPPAGLGVALPGASKPAISVAGVGISTAQRDQVVNRRQKGDRLPVHMLTGRRQPSANPMPVGCEPVFSQLTASARANGPGRCLAGNDKGPRSPA